MKRTLHLAGYAVRDVARNRWGMVYTAFFAAVTIGLFYVQAQSAKVAVSLMSLCLFLIPLVSVLFGTMYFHNSREFIELVLTQPVSRRKVYLGLFGGLAGALTAGFLIGVGLPAIAMGEWTAEQMLSLALLLGVGSLLTVIYVAIAFLVATMFEDRGKALAAALGAWLFTALVYDGLVLLASTAFSNYPLETPLLVASMANPIDLARVTLLVKTDWSALMGYTGAVFGRYFGTSLGVGVAAASLLLWIVGPLALGLRRFRFKDM